MHPILEWAAASGSRGRRSYLCCHAVPPCGIVMLSTVLVRPVPPNRKKSSRGEKMQPDPPLDPLLSSTTRNDAFVTIGTTVLQERLSEGAVSRQHILIAVALGTLLLKFGVLKINDLEAHEVRFAVLNAPVLQILLGMACAYCTLVYALAVAQDWSQFNVKLKGLDPLFFEFAAAVNRAFNDNVDAHISVLNSTVGRVYDLEEWNKKIGELRAWYDRRISEHLLRHNIPIERHEEAILQNLCDAGYMARERDAALDGMREELAQMGDASMAEVKGLINRREQVYTPWAEFKQSVTHTLDISNRLGFMRSVLEVWVPISLGLLAVAVNIPPVYSGLIRHFPWLRVPQ